ncbi:hypothetical protein [Streptomyces sp. NPDC002537]
MDPRKHLHDLVDHIPAEEIGAATVLLRLYGDPEYRPTERDPLPGVHDITGGGR